MQCKVRCLAALMCVLLASECVEAQVQELPIVGHIGGQLDDSAADPIAFSGNTLLFGAGPTLHIVDIADPQNVQEVSTFLFQNPLQDIGFVNGVTVVSTSAFLHFVDTSDPSAPEVLSSIAHVNAEGLAVSGHLVFLGGGNGIVVDAADPRGPVTLASIPVNAVDISILNGYAYFLNATGGQNAIEIIDVRNPVAPVSVTSFTAGTTTLETIEIHNGILYAGSTKQTNTFDPVGLFTFELSDPLNPVQLDFFEVTNVQFGGAEGISFDGNTAYLSADRAVSGMHEIIVLDVSDPANLQQTVVIPNCGQEAIVVQGSLAAVGGCPDLISIVDISDTNNPVTLWDLNSIVGTPVLRGEKMLVIGGVESYVIPLGRKEFDGIATTIPTAGGAFDVNGNVFYTTEGGNTGLNVWDISELEAPVQIASTATPGLHPVNAIDVKGSYGYVALGSPDPMLDRGLRIFDISIPTSPIEVSFSPTVGSARDVAVQGQIAHVIDETSLYLFDVSNPQNPSQLSSLPVPGGPRGLDVAGDYAYVIAPNAFRVIDVSTPTSPVEIGLDSTNGTHNRVLVTGDRAFVTSSAGFRLLDISDPTTPTIVASKATNSFGSIAIGRFVYATGHTGTNAEFGLFQFAVPPPAPVLNAIPDFIDTGGLTVSGTAVAGSFVTVGGGVEPQFQQLAEGTTAFSIEVELRQEAVNTLSVTTLNEFGLVSLPAIRSVVEGVAYPSTVETVTALAITPDPAADVPLDGTLAFTCTATFSDSSTADVSQFVQWEDTANGELITPGGLYVNTKPGTAQVRAFVAGVFSNVVSIGDGP